MNLRSTLPDAAAATAASAVLGVELSSAAARDGSAGHRRVGPGVECGGSDIVLGLLHHTVYAAATSVVYGAPATPPPTAAPLRTPRPAAFPME
ncbi:hypothetical protein SAMN05661080_01958 [Modestobacter sp. DSM 44400]|uniref:hypothetical protein n=1 Tax=Modestobacter sp. DSM 44400 TaxID=1550230 RepID=UPI0008979228|nr:hypothetical protein [Modestobacter sp. DSM 44400]SDX99132.1 hypothetical protein SAMN05661080_01958 [Modestobacter sp. DSM 44400]